MPNPQADPDPEPDPVSAADAAGPTAPYGPDAATRRRRIARSVWITVPGTLALLAAGYALTPEPQGLSALADRLAYAWRWLFLALLPYAAMCLHILALRFIEGAHNPLIDGGSERLRIHGRVMQNTLEQLVWFALCVLALAASLAPAQMRLLPVACGLFVAGRLLYWWGYLRAGTLGRAPGVQVGFTLNVTLLVLAAGSLLRG